MKKIVQLVAFGITAISLLPHVSPAQVPAPAYFTLSGTLWHHDYLYGDQVIRNYSCNSVDGGWSASTQWYGHTSSSGTIGPDSLTITEDVLASVEHYNGTSPKQWDSANRGVIDVYVRGPQGTPFTVECTYSGQGSGAVQSTAPFNNWWPGDVEVSTSGCQYPYEQGRVIQTHYPGTPDFTVSITEILPGWTVRGNTGNLTVQYQGVIYSHALAIPWTRYASVMCGDNHDFSAMAQWQVTRTVHAQPEGQPTLQIAQPEAGKTFYMTADEGRSQQVPMGVTWTGSSMTDLCYHVQVSYTSPITNKMHNWSDGINKGTDDSQFNRPLSGMGGTLTVYATATIDGQSITSSPVTAELRGYHMDSSIKTSIIHYLTSLYADGHSPSLLVGIADLESKFSCEQKGQFSEDGSPYMTNSTNQEYALSGGTPVAVGLMQLYLPVHPEYDNMATYWDWQKNADEGLDVFRDMIRKVNNRVGVIRSGSWAATLGDPSPGQIENWALCKYNGYSVDVYKMNSTRTGWIVNPALPPGAKAYVNVVRDKAATITGDDSVKDDMIP